MNEEELKLTKRYISSENKIKRLLTILTDEPDRKFSDHELAKLLGNSNQSFRVLKSRLFDKIKEILLLDEHFDETNSLSERERIGFKSSKQIILVKSIMKKLNPKRFESCKLLLAEVIKNAKKYEIFDLLVESLILEKQIKALRQGINEYNKINKQILFYENCYKSVKSDFRQALSYCSKLLNLINKNPVLYSRDRIGFIIANQV